MVIIHCGCNYVKISTGYWYIRMYMRTSVFQNLIFFLLLMDSAFFSIGMYLNFFVASHIHVHVHVF